MFIQKEYSVKIIFRDFEQLKIDQTLDFIYASGGLDYIKINGKDHVI